MGRYFQIKPYVVFILCILVSGSFSASASDDVRTMEEQVTGLWRYTGLTTSDGKDMPLHGIFLFQDGRFVQYAVFKGEPAKDQRAMAHQGSYEIGEEFLHLVAEQTLSTMPQNEPPLSSVGMTHHDLAVTRSGSALELVFSKGTGTVQDFEYIGPGAGEVYLLKNGALALVDGYFILVDGDAAEITSGYGSYTKQDDVLELEISHWTEADQSAAANQQATRIKATFDGQALILEDGRRFEVLH